MKRDKLIIFDFDGVLADTIDLCLSIVHMYNPAMTKTELQSFFMGNIFDSLATKPMVVKEPEDFDFQGIFKPKLLAMEPIPGVTEFLQKLNHNDSIIVSSTRSDSIIEFLEKFDLLKYFAAVQGQDVERSKVKKFQKIVEENPAKELVFITDTVGDILEAEKFKMFTIAVTWGYQDKATLAKAKPDCFVENLEELYKAISNYK